MALERMELSRASSIGSDARRGMQEHPTVKPTAMLKDALLDLTNRGDIVVDPFRGSGSTLVAADKTGRVCHGIELGNAAVLVETDEAFDVLAALMSREATV